MSRAHRFILTREDRVAQAWSDVKAISTGVFFKAADDQNEFEQPALASWDHYWFWVGLLIRQNIEAETWLSDTLAENGLSAPVIAYEDVLSDEGLNRNVVAILGSGAGSVAPELKTASTRFRRRLTYQDVGVIVKLRTCIDGERTLYPANPCHLALLGDAVIGKDEIIIHPPLGGIIARPRLLTSGILRLDFSLDDSLPDGQPMVIANADGERIRGCPGVC
jgi:hypothetical protein